MPIGTPGKLDHGIHMLWLGIEKQLPESGRSRRDGLAHRLEHLGVGILRGIFEHLFKHVHLLECVLAHVVQLAPQPIQLGKLRVIEHQALQVLVFSMEQHERHHLIDGHDLGIAKCGRK